MKPIADWQELKLGCHFCNKRQSVKYVNDDGRPCCNLCIFLPCLSTTVSGGSSA